MGRWFSTLLLVIVAAIAVVLVVPSFIDWNQFRDEIEAQASRVAGRQVHIAGDIGFRMLPSPSLILGDLTVDNPEDAGAPLVSAGRLDASAAWWPLFLGRIELARLALVEPVIRLAIKRDGTTNWSVRDPRFAPPPRREGQSGTGLLPPAFAEGLAQSFASIRLFSLQRIAIRNVTVERGTLLYSDARNGAADRADAITGRLRIEARDGPMSGQVAFALAGAPLRLDLALDKFIRGTASPATITLGFGEGGGTLEIKGGLSGAQEALAARKLAGIALNGRLTLESPQSNQAARGLVALAMFGTSPNGSGGFSPWSRIRSLPVSFTGELRLSESNIVLTNGEGTLGQTQATLALVRGRDNPRLDIEAATDLLHLDEIIDLSRPGGSRLAPLGAATGPLESAGGCHCEGIVHVSAAKVLIADTTLSDFDLRIKLVADGAELTNATITLPGNSLLTGAGRMPAGAPDGVIFDGQMTFGSERPRVFMEWLGLPVERASPEVLTTLALDAPVKLVDRFLAGGERPPGTVAYAAPRIEGATLTLDDQAYTLSFAYDDREPALLQFSFEGERLNSDAYGLGLFWWPAKPFETASWSGTLWGRAARATDVDIIVRLGTLITAEHAAHGLTATLTRKPGMPSSAHIEVTDLSGYRIVFDGERQAPQGDIPPDLSANLDVSGAGKPIEFPFAGKPMAGSLALHVALNQTANGADWRLGGSIGAIKLAGRGTGPASMRLIPDIERLSLTADLSTGEAKLSGALRGLTIGPSFEGSFTVDATDFAPFMRELGYQYESRRDDLGAFSLVARGMATAERIDLAALAASVGKQSLEATAALVLTGERPQLQADIVAGDVSLDGFLPLPDKATPWSTERIKAGIFRAFDGAIRLRARRFEVGPYDLYGLDSGISVKDSVVATENLRATLYDGTLAMSGAVTVHEDELDSTFSGTLARFGWTGAAEKLFPALTASGTGEANMKFSGRASGRSLFTLARGFSGAFDIQGSGGAIDGFDLLTFSERVPDARGEAAFRDMAEETLSDGSTGLERFSLRASASAGTIEIDESDFEFAGGTGTLDGSIELPARKLDLTLYLVADEDADDREVGLVVEGPIAGPARSFAFED